MARLRNVPAATFRSTWTAALSQPAGQVTEMLPVEKPGKFAVTLFWTAVTMSARGLPGGGPVVALQVRIVPSDCIVFAPARAPASPAFWRWRRVTSRLAPSRRSAPAARMTTIDKTNSGRIWPAWRSRARPLAERIGSCSLIG